MKTGTVATNMPGAWGLRWRVICGDAHSGDSYEGSGIDVEGNSWRQAQQWLMRGQQGRRGG